MRRTRFLIYAGAQFVVLTTCAMFAYAGGTPYEPTAEHYRFFHNFLSDLGSTVSFGGHTNYPSSALFAVALATLGAALVAFASAWRELWFAHERAARLGTASHVIGTLSGLAFVGVALTPWNVSWLLHGCFVAAGFGLLLLYVACVTVLLVLNDGPRALVGANAIYVAVLLAYIAYGVVGPSLDTPDGHMSQVTAQKIVAYGSMVELVALAWMLPTSSAAR